ncbi:plastocyanin/azurin family copper-binding protein [Maribacter sp. 2210JD10-5]|uniref:plastocyanin/azurin family copper-binding protein n=1 Tax=Maribacter sp. 2210JD10-5 TaxID=3386272 RepID=UPI0039BCC52A
MKALKHILSFLVLLMYNQVCGQAQDTEAMYYPIEKISIPEEIALEIGGLAFNDKGQLGAITRRGELWLILNPNNDNPNFVRFAHGLHEPLGLAFKDGSFYANQRGELTKITDTDGDNEANEYETITTWELYGNYHEYSYGPLFTEDGDMVVTLNLGWEGKGVSKSKWSGWMLKVSPNGEVKPYATGLRSPAGMGINANGDIFYTENQGDWVGSGRMTHLELGDFAGNPEGLHWSQEKNSPLSINFEDIDDTKELTLYEYKDEIDAVKPPSVWFPHTLMGISTSDIAFFNDKMGPFTGQMMVGDQGHSKIMRVFQEKINGVYQGVCFPFIDGFSSGVLRLQYNPEKDAVYVGQTSRGWASRGQDSYALERFSWTGKMPFEVKTIKVKSDGFMLEFTQPVNEASAKEIASYQVTDFTYKYHHFYGSPVHMKEARTIKAIELSEDGLSATLKLDKFRKGFIYEIKASGVKNRSGKPLLHDFGYYTLNEVPDENNSIVASSNDVTTKVESSNLRVTELPAAWKGKVDVEIQLGTLPGLKFDKTELTVKAGEKVKLTFNNSDDMPHNFVFVNPDKANEVGEAALKLGLDGMEMSFIPKSDEILAHTNMVAPQDAESIYFTAPTEPGIYEYVCTFPGHHTVMRGILKVE